MKVEIYWCGTKKYNPKRVWGYLTNNGGADCVVFWGMHQGKMQYRTTRFDREFYKNRNEKIKSYEKNVSEVRDFVLQDYKETVFLRKLKNGY
jgi:hypothetical protein